MNSPEIVAEPGKLWIGSIVIDCKNWEQMIAFWKAALGYEFCYPPSEDWAMLYDPHGEGPNVSFQKDPTGPTGIYWFHFDLYSSDPENEVQRLLKLGAERKQPAQEGTDYVTLADPDGNPFDVIEKRGFKIGQRTK
jgi:catechol 2,3-dioxygenase-like lactoylglutathione lyase family enzyme